MRTSSKFLPPSSSYTWYCERSLVTKSQTSEFIWGMYARKMIMSATTPIKFKKMKMSLRKMIFLMSSASCFAMPCLPIS